MICLSIILPQFELSKGLFLFAFYTFKKKRWIKQQHTHTEEMAERTKRSKVWLNFTRLDVDNTRCQKFNKSLACKGGNLSNLSKQQHIMSRNVPPQPQSQSSSRRIVKRF